MRSSLVKLLSVINICWTLFSVSVGEQFFLRRDHLDQINYMRRTTENVVKSQDDAEVILEKYGYLSCKVSRRKRDVGRVHMLPGYGVSMTEEGQGRQEACDDSQVENAIKEYQKTYNLRETGVLDEETKRLMSTTRCGNKDTETTVVKKNTTTPDTGQEVHSSSQNPAVNSISKEKTDTESNDSGAPFQRLWKRSVNNNKLFQVLTRGKRETFLQTRTRILNEYVNRIKRNDPLMKQPLTHEERSKRSVIVNGRRNNETHQPTEDELKAKDLIWKKQEIRWRLLETGYSTHIPVEDQRATIDLAFRMWSEVTPLKFMEDIEGDIRDVDIEVAFGRGAHGNCQQDFDGNGGEVAHSWVGGNMHFDDDENYKSIRTYRHDGIYLLRIAVHEIGHVLGLSHTNKSFSIMYAIYNKLNSKPSFELNPLDRKAVQAIYGVCKGKFSTVLDWVRKRPDNSFIFNTYFFRDNHYWMYENHANRTRYGDPLRIAREWSGVPNLVDGYAHIWYITGNQMVDKAFFYKGEDYYAYNSETDSVMDGYPKKIKDDFGPMADQTESIPNNIDTVYFDMRDRNLYFFKHDMVYVYDPKTENFTNGCCVRKRKIVEEFPALEGEDPLPNDLDAVYYSYKDQAIYFIKDEYVWHNALFNIGQKVIQNGVKKDGLWYNKWFDICDI
ncbi:matrix metallopeptidase-21 [Patella vulgata]|uniref:matrix metallopeptidase-21 n=1 Tax=Patella vulgata TaxID=6465 RepID=UPI00217F71F2|nr:matrix metallopeptidase-21 [Patella vulgata]XP_050396045.1 matrix metallopeptidase-21 [Patella vulgata]XP_050396046.1 matrix metallopeptidase-21 [Patella vulgata]XP_050396047.1 matrix metallopeptidase-21 [Patella vulgata]XP_050396048.1 matrix metallopeptidase-21 [Patella vulgata]XP_050396049.1 matrix metallopeptidase-21 [Patella vulgata]XP_050396050.1 matrix metallopeptidase-21 [Patella vulgata]XP_050396052.1 matrix metallopeptidase-21 [Patella vulgata]